jgi:intracellular multiplication protein IcmQ
MAFNNMTSLDDETKANLEILKALNEAIEDGPWEHNLFFRGIGKKLRDARDRFQRELGLDELLKEESVQASVAESDQQFTEVYISLYQSEGANIQKWASVIGSLVGHSISRPVYKNEEDIQAAIRAKDYKINDGYVAVRVPNALILKPYGDKLPLDRFGRELLILREDAVQLDKILYFVHISGRYILSKGTLIKQA